MLLPWRDIPPAPPGGGVLGPNRLPRLEITFRSAFCNAQSFRPGVRLSVAPPSPAPRAGSAPCGLAKPCDEGRSPVGPGMAGAGRGGPPSAAARLGRGALTGTAPARNSPRRGGRPAGAFGCSGKHSFRPAAVPCAEISCEPFRTDRRTAQNPWVLADSRPGLPLPRSGRWSALGQAVRFACACGVRARLGAPPGRGFSASGPGGPRPARGAAKRSARIARLCKHPPSPRGGL
jgi:hypothetical protein